MSKYLPVVTFTIPFDGDDVIVKMRALEREDGIRVTAFVGKQNEPGALALFMELYRKYTISTGLVDAIGAPIDIETVLRDAYFVVFIVGAVLKLVQAATPQNPTPPVTLVGERSSGTDFPQPTKSEGSPPQLGSNCTGDVPE